MSKLIIKNCNVCELDLPLKVSSKIYKDFSIKHPNRFYLLKRINRSKWDGIIHFVGKTGSFKIGLLPSIYEKCKEYGEDPEIIDMRRPYDIVSKPITRIGEYKLRTEQVDALKSIINHKLGDIPFHIGVIDATVNFGKSLLMSALYLSFKRKLKTLLITQDSDWLNQSKDEFKQYLPGETITFIQGGKINNWANFSIGMVQSISRNIKKYQNELAKIDMVLVDEADLAGNKSYQTVLTHLYNTRIRLGLSGTIYMSKLKRDLLKNMNIEAFFGKKLYEFRLNESMKKGYSTNTVVKLIDTSRWYSNWESEFVDYQDIYNDTITNNPIAWQVVKDRLLYNINYGRIPALIVCKFIEHCENLYKFLSESLELKSYNIRYVHVNTKTKERKQIMKDFREGKIDILVSTTIIARGKNFPLLKYMINTASMNSQEKSIQFLGRLVRTNKGKSKAYLDDIQFQGDFLSRHSKHRKRYYISENLKVISVKS